MSTRVVDRVENWNERSFTEGYQTLTDLAEEEFSGVIRTGSTALFMTKGVAIGIEDGDITDFDGAAGTAYESPSPALPVLAVMQADNEGVRDEFYSEKTSLAEVDSKLSDGGFTGYIELSENVLSGDYYLVYHGGRSMSVGFVGESARLIDGDEAFETANDEVGIYQIRPAEISPLDLPEPPEPAEAEPDDDSEAGDTQAPEADAGADDMDESPADDAAETTGTDDEVATSDRATPEQSSPGEETEDKYTGSESNRESAESSADTAADTRSKNESETQQDQNTSDSRQTQTDSPQSGPARTDTPSTQADSHRPTESVPPSTHSQTSPRQGKQGPIRQSQGHSQPIETYSVPSLDPTRTQEKQTEPATRTHAGRPTSQPSGQRQQPAHQSHQQSPTPSQSQEQARTTTPVQSPPQTDSTAPASQPADDTERKVPDSDESSESDGAEAAAQEARVSELEAKKEELDERVEELETERDELEAENQELTAELEAVRSERNELAAEVEQLESEITRLESEFGAATDAEQRITPQEALQGTDIFFRYKSKGDTTLDTAHDGDASRQELNNNLRLEKHTQFDANSVSVGGQTYAEFLDSTVEYQFVEWLVRELLFEIWDTGHAKPLQELYDVLPNVDRAELGGIIEVQTMEDGEEITLEESFDIVLRDRMGGPLLVANLNDSREAATAGMMERLITSAELVGQSVEEFAGAFFVTRSFFEPGALEIAGEATKSGFLKRNKRKSFVNLSRKTGYHLCLVEARNDNFHMAVPEL